MNTLLISEFCRTESDTRYSGDSRKRRSVLLQINRDIDFNLGMHGIFRLFNLSTTLQRYLESQSAPLFVVPILYCSAIDLLARVKHKGTLPGRNAAIFKESARLFFKFDANQADIIWDFRNSLMHQYSISNFTLSRSGSSNVLEDHDGRKVVFVRAMRQSLAEAMVLFEQYLLNENNDEHLSSVEFLEQHGFTYYLI